MDDNVEPRESDKNLDGCASKGGGESGDVVQILDVNVDKSDVVVPKVGMKFGSVEEIHEFYRSYAVKTGFGCKIRSSKKDEGILRHVTYTCVREGKHKSVSNTPFELDPTAKCGCKAKITACLDLDDKWKIIVFVSEHNHRTIPSKTRFMRCNKLIKKSVKRKILINDKAGIRMNKNYNIQVVDAGGHEHLTYDDKDLRNMIAREKHLELGEGDATALRDHFEKMQKMNIDFYHSISLNHENRLQNVFWADKRCREAYKEFGDVVTFDTTYLTNKYDMPFAPFVGVNQHGQSILFGCGLLANEEIETFTWLFKTWLDCMGGIAPPAIITDQCSAMKAAVEIVFPEAKHRWCLWHIMKKIPKRLGGYEKYLNIKCRMKRAVYEAQCPAEFEQKWSEMLEKYTKLKSNKWLNKLYQHKNRWVPCYVTTTFWAGMSTTQRSESLNAFFDGYVHSRTSLKQFVEQFENALRFKMEKELKEDARSFSKDIPTTTSYEIEEQMQSNYTMEKFKEFQKELTGKIYCEIIDVKNEIQDGIQVIRYDVQQEIWYYRLPIVEDENETSEEWATGSSNQENVVDQENKLKDDDEEEEENKKAKKVMKHVMFKVWFQKDGCKVNCSCRRFEFRGILCTHAICVLLRNNVTSIPEEYILRRWRKDVRLAHTKVPLTSDSWQLTPDQKRYKDMCDYFADLADAACQNDGKCNNIMKWIGEQLKVLTEEGSNAATEMITSEVNNVTEVSQEVPTQQSLASTVQFGTMNLSHEQYHQFSLGVPQIHAGGSLANGMNMLDFPHISPYGHPSYVSPIYGAPQQWDNGAPQQWDNGRHALTYGGFQMHGRAQEVSEVSPYTAFGPPLQFTLGSGFSQR